MKRPHTIEKVHFDRLDACTGKCSCGYRWTAPDPARLAMDYLEHRKGAGEDGSASGKFRFGRGAS